MRRPSLACESARAMTPQFFDPAIITEPRSAGRCAAPGASAVNLFWPSRNEHLVRSIVLSPPRELYDPRTLGLMREVTLLAGAIRSGEDSEMLEGWIDMLKARSAKLLDRIAASLSCAASATNLVLRAQALRGQPLAALAGELAKLDEQALFALCGGLATWHGKSRAIYHSALFAAIDHEAEALIARVAALRAETEAYLRTLVSPRLVLGVAPLMKITRLFLCGGEANFYPKHFTYFLPEDEGVKRAPLKKTVVFGNIYQALYSHVTVPFVGRRATLATAPEAAADVVYDRLVLWIRGHDTGHQVRLPETDYQVLRAQGRWLSMVLQECLADVFGFLMSAGGPWSSALPQRLSDRTVAGVIFLREMLRYLCRGGDDFPDAGAALIELSFLVRKGYLDADPEVPALSTTFERLHEGIRGLAAALTATVLANDERATAAFVETYYRQGLRDLVARFGTCSTVLDYVQDLGEEVTAGGGELPIAPAAAPRLRGGVPSRRPPADRA
jgi:hypothetical protein